MTRIVYEKTDSESHEARLEIMGTSLDLIRALVQIVYTMHNRMGLNVDKFSLNLPDLVELESLSLDRTVMIDKSKLRKEDGK